MASSPQRRPGGRTAETSSRIFDATLDLLVEGGMAGCTVQAVADRADVARATIYRRWPDRTALVADALSARLENAVQIPDTGSFADDLRALLANLAAFLTSPLGRAAIVVAAESDSGAQEARALFQFNRLAAISPLFDRAAGRGEIDAATDRLALLGCAVGALYFRLLVLAEPIDDTWIARIVAQSLTGPDTKAGGA